jgi:orotate phosphoribosyltransferase
MSLLLGTAVSLEVGLPVVVVDGHQVRGARYAGEIVVPIEDVVLSGATALSTVQVLRSVGLIVNDVVAAVDRGSGASKLLAADDVTIRAVFHMPMGVA